MTGAIDWIAADWGTSHLRLWLMGRDLRVLDRIGSDRGMARLTARDYEPVLLDLIGDRLPAGRVTPVICCGTAGARQGWSEAPYSAVPCRPGAWDRAVRPLTADLRLSVAILPGLSQQRPADVMRGEETQIAGFLASQPDFDGVLCLPGTHCKWVHLSAGEVVSFRSFMTGEMFGLLSSASVLRHSVAPSGTDETAFAAAVDQAISRPATVAAELFSLRAESLLAGLDPVAARARLSGLLIGIELAGARPYWLGQDIVILGTGELAEAYGAALSAQGLSPRHADAEAMTLAGLTAARTALKGTR